MVTASARRKRPRAVDLRKDTNIYVHSGMDLKGGFACGISIPCFCSECKRGAAKICGTPGDLFGRAGLFGGGEANQIKVLEVGEGGPDGIGVNGVAVDEKGIVNTDLVDHCVQEQGIVYG